MAAEAAAIDRLDAWLAGARPGGSLIRVRSLKPLAGGAIQENWLAETECADGEFAGLGGLVLRKDARATIAASHGRAEEFRLLGLAHAGGVTVPRPVAFCTDPEVLGGPFAAMARVEGVGFGPGVVKDARLGGDREALGARLGRELALIHRLRPEGDDFAFLGAPPARPAQHEIDWLRAGLDAMAALRPASEWALRWCERHQPEPPRVVLCHKDFRTGNYMVDAHGLTGILDWEFAGWGDPHMDLGWLTAKCWRFSRPDLEAGGVASREAFLGGYEAESGFAVDREAVLFWEVMAHLRWGVIALMQGERHNSGVERSLALALTGRMIAELEWEALKLTEPARWTA